MAIKLFLACPGLGRVNRGYESFARELTEALAQSPEVDVTVYKGGGEREPKSFRVWNLPRDGRLANLVGDKLGRSAYFIEEVTFFLAFAPRLLLGRPDVVLTSDLGVAKLMWFFRKITRGKYKLLFSNGGPIYPPFRKCDHQHQVAPTHYDAALQDGLPVSSQTLLPYGVQMTTIAPILSRVDQQKLRRELNLPTDRPIILSVGTLDKGHKRMDYTVREVAALPTPRPFLLLLGHRGPDTPEIEALGRELLGDDFDVRSVPHPEVTKYYQAADVFVLSSVFEGLARVFLEALSHGLPPLVHDYDITRYAFEDLGYYGDFKQAGSLTNLLQRVLDEENKSSEDDNRARREARFQSAYRRFSWQSLRAQYIAMIERTLKS